MKFNPEEEKQHLFVAGTADKKIVCVSKNIFPATNNLILYACIINSECWVLV